MRGEALLALADGTIYRGVSFGAARGMTNPVVGEVVFNTSMYGYQEILTDPSYAGQIICFTYPHIGNVGCNDEDDESEKVFAEGIVIRNLSRIYSNFRSEKSLEQYLEKAGIMGISNLDTREVVAHIRDKGAQMGAFATGENLNASDLVDIARAQGSMEGKDYVKHVTCKESYTWNCLPWSLEHKELKGTGFEKLSQDKLLLRPHVVAVDCGIKFNILRLLLHSGFRVTVVPATAKSEFILSLNPDALFLSNGPGDPATLSYVVSTVKDLIGRFPIFGICLGHQILAQAVGAKTFKLKFGHRGGNHPVMDMASKKVEITVQNHGFAVDSASVPKDVKISHLNLNDKTVEGLDIPQHKAFCVQYHPEASPGPHDSRYLFRRFFEGVVGYKNGGSR